MASLFRTPAAARMLSTAAVPRSIIKVGTPLFQQGAMMGRRVNMNITGNAQVNGGMNVASRVGVAAFHTTKKMQIFPAPPRECLPSLTLFCRRADWWVVLLEFWFGLEVIKRSW